MTLEEYKEHLRRSIKEYEPKVGWDSGVIEIRDYIERAYQDGMQMGLILALDMAERVE